MVSVRKYLEERYKLGNTVSGTRNYHYFEPVSTTVIRTKSVCISYHSFSKSQEEMVKSLNHMKYITCQYDSFSWLALVN